MAEVLKGASCAKALTEELAERTNALKEKGVTPTLALLRVGERGDDIAYENAAVKRCEKVGIEVKKFLLPADAKKEEILSAIRTINIDESIHGCLMFRPLADKDIESAAARLLLPEKDVDCMTVGSLATVFSGGGAGYPPCTAEAVVRLLKYYDVPLAGRKVTVAGRSLVIGKPVSMLLLANHLPQQNGRPCRRVPERGHCRGGHRKGEASFEGFFQERPDRRRCGHQCGFRGQYVRGLRLRRRRNNCIRDNPCSRRGRERDYSCSLRARGGSSGESFCPPLKTVYILQDRHRSDTIQRYPACFLGKGQH